MPCVWPKIEAPLNWHIFKWKFGTAWKQVDGRMRGGGRQCHLQHARISQWHTEACASVNLSTSGSWSSLLPLDRSFRGAAAAAAAPPAAAAQAPFSCSSPLLLVRLLFFPLLLFWLGIVQDSDDKCYFRPLTISGCCQRCLARLWTPLLLCVFLFFAVFAPLWFVGGFESGSDSVSYEE